MKKLLIGIMMIMTAVTIFVGCGDKKSDGGGGGDGEATETVEFYQGKLDGTFSGSNDITYTFSGGKVTEQEEGKDDKSGSFTVSEYDSDGDGEEDSIAVRITIKGNSSSYVISMDGDNVVFTEGSRKIILTKK